MTRIIAAVWRRARLPEGTQWQNVNVLCHISMNTAFHKVYYSIMSVIEMFMMLFFLFHLLLNLLNSSANWKVQTHWQAEES